MAGKPMQVRKAVPPSVSKALYVMSTVGKLEKATHEQRATAIHALLELGTKKEPETGIDKASTYGAIAIIACIDGAPPQKVIEYATNAIADGDDALALRARMHLKEGNRGKALETLRGSWPMMKDTP
jgi:hypothetical protein